MRVTRLSDTVAALAGPVRRGSVRRWWTIPVAACTVTAVVVMAAGSAAATPPGDMLAIASSLDQVLTNLRNWLIGILAALATVCLTVAGARYVIGAGDPAEMEKAKSAFRAACLGYALAMLAPLIVAVLQSIVGA